MPERADRLGEDADLRGAWQSIDTQRQIGEMWERLTEAGFRLSLRDARVAWKFTRVAFFGDSRKVLRHDRVCLASVVALSAHGDT